MDFETHSPLSGTTLKDEIWQSFTRILTCMNSESAGCERSVFSQICRTVFGTIQRRPYSCSCSTINCRYLKQHLWSVVKSSNIKLHWPQQSICDHQHLGFFFTLSIKLPHSRQCVSVSVYRKINFLSHHFPTCDHCGGSVCLLSISAWLLVMKHLPLPSATLHSILPHHLLSPPSSPC